MILYLDPKVPGDWLAAWHLGPKRGRWLDPINGPYEFSGVLPSAPEIRGRLRDAEWDPDSRWMRHAGAGQPSKTAEVLYQSLEVVDLDLPAWKQAITSKVAGWMICERWRRPPSAYAHKSDTSQVPIAVASMAFLGASKIGDWAWIGKWRAVVPVWLSPGDVESYDVMVFDRRQRSGEPHSGALGDGVPLRLEPWRPPTWMELVELRVGGRAYTIEMADETEDDAEGVAQ